MAGVLTYANFLAQIVTRQDGTPVLPPHYLQSTSTTTAATIFLGPQPPQGTLRFRLPDFVLYWLHNYWASRNLPAFQPGTFARSNPQWTVRPARDSTSLTMLEADVIRAHVHSSVCFVSHLAAQWARMLGFYILSRAEVTSDGSRVDLVWYAAHNTEVLDPGNWAWPPNPAPEGEATGANMWRPILVLEYKRPRVIMPGGAWDLGGTTGFHHEIAGDGLSGYEKWFLWKQWKKTGAVGGAVPPQAQYLVPQVLAVHTATNAGNPRWVSGNAANLAKQAWAYQQQFKPGRVLLYDSLRLVMFDYTRLSPGALNVSDNVMGFAWMDLSDDNNPNSCTFSMVLFASIVAGLVEKYF